VQSDEHNEVTPLLELHHYLISVADLLNLVALHAIHVLYVIGEPFEVYFFAIVKSGIHEKLLTGWICSLLPVCLL
jgi:hypothetical protein